MKKDFSLTTILQKTQDVFSPRTVAQRIGRIWMQSFHYTLVLLFLAVALWGVFVWYTNVQNSEWSQERKDEYVRTQQLKAQLHEERLQRVLDDIAQRQKRYGQKQNEVQDIFYP